ncbi:MAG: nucleotide sugar dehydrogenase [Pseudomonadota bacterium]
MNPLPDLTQHPIAIIGLGYVGLPLAVEFGKQFSVLGFDISAARVAELQQGHDSTLEVPAAELAAAVHLRCSTDAAELRACRVFIVTVPTPVDQVNRPDMGPLVAASQTVGQALKPGDVVVYESTVYPGATEEVCVPVLERSSGLRYNHDFYCGYSPERINPGDKAHRLPSIKKVTSGSTPEVAAAVDALYARIITAGTHKASSIRVAEAAKVIENTQRDVNIALINELAILFNRLGIDTEEVLQAAGSKWNFLPFRPGLVGGHCIGVDPYYLTHKAQEVGYHPEVILAGRRINDGMGAYVADQLIRLMLRRALNPVGARVLVLGLSFKEDCPDLRNTKVIDVVRTLQGYQVQVAVYDPWASAAEAQHEYGLALLPEPAPAPGAPLYDAIVIAVAHRQFRALGAAALRAWLKPQGLIYDVKHLLPRAESDARL